MAAYFSKLNGSVYEGQYVAAADLENGTFVSLNSDGKVAALTAASTCELRVVEKTELWGKDALRVRVDVEDGKVFMVEGSFDTSEIAAYDDAEHKVKAGKLVRMRTPHISDEILIAVDATIFNAAKVGDIYTPAAKGGIAKKG